MVLSSWRILVFPFCERLEMENSHAFLKAVGNKSLAVLRSVSKAVTNRRFIYGVTFTLAIELILLYIRLLRNTPKAPLRTKPKMVLSQPLKELRSDKDRLESQTDCDWFNTLMRFLIREMKHQGKLNTIVTNKILKQTDMFFEKRLGHLIGKWVVKDYDVVHDVDIAAPFFAGMYVDRVVVTNDVIETLQVKTSMRYVGRFNVMLSATLPRGRRVVSTVELQMLSGNVRFEFTRSPAPSWNFAFSETPLMEIKTNVEMGEKSHPKRSALLLKMIKRKIKKKHTLPNFKPRAAPFFWKDPSLKDLYRPVPSQSTGGIPINRVDSYGDISVYEDSVENSSEDSAYEVDGSQRDGSEDFYNTSYCNTPASTISSSELKQETSSTVALVAKKLGDLVRSDGPVVGGRKLQSTSVDLIGTNIDVCCVSPKRAKTENDTNDPDRDDRSRKKCCPFLHFSRKK